MNCAAVFASGHGIRMGSPVPKQFLSIDGEPIIVKSIRVFLDNKNINSVIVAVPADFYNFSMELLSEYFNPGSINIIPGGETRNDTLLAVVDFAANSLGMQKGDILLTHDAVRPYIDSRIIDENISSAAEAGACNTVIPAVDSLITSEDGCYASGVLERSRVYLVQTPQSFEFSLLRGLIEAIPEEKLRQLTDAASIATLAGVPVKLVEGSRDNIKITFPSDI